MEELTSKSQKKREAEALQKIGLEFVSLPLAKLGLLPLSENLRQAIIDAKTIKSHGAMRRQAQLIGKLMRSADYDAIAEAYEAMRAESSAQTAGFHELEQWRDRLINEDNTVLTQFIHAYPMVDVQPLRQLIKKAVDEKNKGLHLGASKALFRFLRSSLT